MTFYCTVKGCRHNDKHTVDGHLCCKCNNYGHGPFECGDLNMILSLKINNIPEDSQCTVENCRYSKFHTIKGHLCRICKQYGHGYKQCGYASPSQIAGSAQGKIYIAIYEGMGCFGFYKRDNADALFQVYHMPSDSWGQYGVDERPNLKAFLNGYRPLRESDNPHLN
jgi:hypothetical protein